MTTTATQQTPETTTPEAPAETTETATPAENHPQIDQGALAAPESDVDDSTAGESSALRKARQEAADRRVTAREATERAEALSAQLEETQAHAQRLEDAILARAFRAQRVSLEAVKALGYTAADVLGEDLAADPQRVEQIAEDVAGKFGHLPQSPLEAEREAFAGDHDWPADLLHGDDEQQWRQQIDALKRELAVRFPHLTQPERQQQVEQAITGQSSPAFDELIGEKFLAWAVRHQLYDPSAPMPPRDPATAGQLARRGQAPASGSGDPSGGAAALSWTDLFSH